MGAVGIVLGIREADGTTRIVSYGSAGDGARDLSSRSLFEIGSISKVFTATLLADMVQKGEVSLDDPVTDFLPEGVSVPSRNGRQITLLDLATHHSGLPGLPDDWPDASGPVANPDYPPDRLYAFLSRHELDGDVGAEYSYSNIGVGLLGHVLARVGGGSFEDVLRERVLDPLRMNLTSTRRDGSRAEWMTLGHDSDGEVAPYRDFPNYPGMGGLHSNVEELLLFLEANVGVPRTPLEEAMRDAHSVRRQYSPERGVGLNWFTWTVGDARIVGHTGGTLGYDTFIGFDPESGVGVVILGNVRVPTWDIAMHLINPKYPLQADGVNYLGAGVAVLTLTVLLVGILLYRSRRPHARAFGPNGVDSRRVDAEHNEA